MGHAFRPVREFGGSIYWVALIGTAFIATTITTLIADPTNVYYGPIIAESNNWTLQALVTNVRLASKSPGGRDRRSGKLGTIRWCGI